MGDVIAGLFAALVIGAAIVGLLDVVTGGAVQRAILKTMGGNE